MSAAYVDRTLAEFIATPDHQLLAELHSAYASDGFVSQYTSQTIAWEESLPEIKRALADAATAVPSVARWRVLLEMPLYRLRRRVDLILVSDQAIAVVELKVGETHFTSMDRRQVEEYALDLRDFHEHSADVPILPVLWCTDAAPRSSYLPLVSASGVSEVVEVGHRQFPTFVKEFVSQTAGFQSRVREDWTHGAYRPVPSVIAAATTLFAGHGVEAIARADAANLGNAAETIVGLIRDAERDRKRALIFLTGVPGSGKTLAGLQVVHRAVESGVRAAGDIVYLSGNTPLVTVLREALTEDEYTRRRQRGEKVSKASVRSSVRVRIQHIMDFLKEYLTDREERPPHERAIVFDEAQRAWNEAYGKQKFGRSASEPRLLLDIMGRHPDWSVIIGLIGGGQEINSGENGMIEWGDAMRSLSPETRAQWHVYGPPSLNSGDQTTAFLGLGNIPNVTLQEVPDLALRVSIRSYRSPRVADWVETVLDNRDDDAAAAMEGIDRFPIRLTRDADEAIQWLRTMGRGERRFGLVASSTASRLRAYGFGVSVSATDGQNIAYWYLNPRGDVRSSFALEVTANEYTTQGLELDFVGVCWGGDLVMSPSGWVTRRFEGTVWRAANNDRRRFILNSYRVLLTRAREGLVIWVPRGDSSDPTRDPARYDCTADFLTACGAESISG